jgi:hypothetical protein
MNVSVSINVTVLVAELIRCEDVNRMRGMLSHKVYVVFGPNLSIVSKILGIIVVTGWKLALFVH